MRKLFLFLSVLLTVVSICFANNKKCETFDNGLKGGLAVFVSSEKDPNDRDVSVQDYINTITIASNGNKMRIITCQIKIGGKWTSAYDPLGIVIEPYDKYSFEFKTSAKKLSSDDIKVTAEGCN